MCEIQVYQEDAQKFLESIPSASVDLVLTDPAYESMEKHRSRGTTTRLKKSKGSSNPWFTIFKNDQFPELFKQMYRVLKKDTHFYMFSNQDTMWDVKPMADAAGFKFHKVLVWDKVNIGMGYHYRARHELILFFSKGKRALNDRSTPDVLPFKRVYRGYPTEKPVPLLEVLVRMSTNPGETVVDPFMGSGSSGEACMNLGRNYLGCDISDDALAVARKRLFTVKEEK